MDKKAIQDYMKKHGERVNAFTRIHVEVYGHYYDVKPYVSKKEWKDPALCLDDLKTIAAIREYQAFRVTEKWRPLSFKRN